MNPVEVAGPAQLEKVFPVLQELRPHLSLAESKEIFEVAKKRDDYRLWAIFEGNTCTALIGYRILFDFVHGKHIYVDDLVTSESHRSKGIGKKLLEFAESEARSLGCAKIRLCTGVENREGIRFYEKNAWDMRALVFKKKLT